MPSRRDVLALLATAPLAGCSADADASSATDDPPLSGRTVTVVGDVPLPDDAGPRRTGAVGDADVVLVPPGPQFTTPPSTRSKPARPSSSPARTLRGPFSASANGPESGTASPATRGRRANASPPSSPWRTASSSSTSNRYAARTSRPDSRGPSGRSSTAVRPRSPSRARRVRTAASNSGASGFAAARRRRLRPLGPRRRCFRTVGTAVVETVATVTAADAPFPDRYRVDEVSVRTGFTDATVEATGPAAGTDAFAVEQSVSDDGEVTHGFTPAKRASRRSLTVGARTVVALDDPTPPFSYLGNVRCRWRDPRLLRDDGTWVAHTPGRAVWRGF
ncbi:hypothetical protein [Halogeometricum sp. CBA1124]|uniref:hypothetical protein n=1 Tax=Halogeometricum sp. CBA1124 TaxID=2668071 RepID=UPI001E3DCF7E|nr:hypothetical protein [Halogeometricum sp. CBA1124]